MKKLKYTDDEILKSVDRNIFHKHALKQKTITEEKEKELFKKVVENLKKFYNESDSDRKFDIITAVEDAVESIKSGI